jgi:hypothetical protein
MVPAREKPTPGNGEGVMVASRRNVSSRPNTERDVEELIRLRDDNEHQTMERARLAASIERYETKYGLKSSDIRGAVAEGRLTETFEVCRWAMDYELLQGTEKRRR